MLAWASSTHVPKRFSLSKVLKGLYQTLYRKKLVLWAAVRLSSPLTGHIGAREGLMTGHRGVFKRVNAVVSLLLKCWDQKNNNTHTHNTQQHTNTFSQTTSWRIRLSHASPHHRKQKAVINIFLTFVWRGENTPMWCKKRSLHAANAMQCPYQMAHIRYSSKNVQLTDDFAAFIYLIKQLINKNAWNWMTFLLC